MIRCGHAPVSQSAEEAALKAVQSGFDPQRGHRVAQDGGADTRARSSSSHPFSCGHVDRTSQVAPAAA